MNKKWLIILSFALSLFLLTACNNDTDESADDNNGENIEEDASPDVAEPDLEGIPDVVAEVNGEEISKEEFESNYQGQYQQALMQSQLSGEEVDQDQLKQDLVELLVGQKLLIQEAENRVGDVSDEDIDETWNELLEQTGMESKEELLTVFEEQGMSEEEVTSQVELQVKIGKLIEEEAGDLEPTDEEIEEAYEMLKSQQEQMGGEEDLPSFDEIKPGLTEQVKLQKEGEVTQTLVETLREDADVTIHI